MASATPPRWLVISQVYVPDPASVGQHLADVAEAFAARGAQVLVLTSDRGYENPDVRYEHREQRAGVEIRRLPLSSFGKKSLLHRLLGHVLFLAQVVVRGSFTSGLSGIIVSTSPPMASLAALVIGLVRRVPLNYWLMDLNPDELVALGKATSHSPAVLAMKWLNRLVFSRAANVVVLDRFMADRVSRQYNVAGHLEVLPPWPHNDCEAEIEPARNPFRLTHGLANRFVVMYSGNHSLVSPVSTLVQAAVELRSDPRFVFLFIGGGQGKADVEAAMKDFPDAQIRSLPYQPLDQIQYSLSAADVHVVTLGNAMPGIIHPCKVYGAMAVGRPVLLIGPRPSHASDIIDRHRVGWQVEQGAVAELTDRLREIAAQPASELTLMGQRSREAVRAEYDKSRLCGAFCNLMERSLHPVERPVARRHSESQRREAIGAGDPGAASN